jgi:hypothetical protein
VIDSRTKFIDMLMNRKDCDHPALRAQVDALTAERDKWRDIAERLYNATHESDYTIMMRAARAYEQACND